MNQFLNVRILSIIQFENYPETRPNFLFHLPVGFIRKVHVAVQCNDKRNEIEIEKKENVMEPSMKRKHNHLGSFLVSIYIDRSVKGFSHVYQSISLSQLYLFCSCLYHKYIGLDDFVGKNRRCKMKINQSRIFGSVAEFHFMSMHFII